MISGLEIREFARRNGIPESTVERDYAQNWLLASLSKEFKMALKGGTGIKKAYIGNYRFSDDLDFTLIEDAKQKEIKGKAIKAIREAKRKCGIDFNDEVIVDMVENGYRARVYFRILRKTGSPLSIVIDLTKKENEIIALPLERKGIIHLYSDDLDAEVLVYSLEEIFAEKFRALFERTRPRDLYDVWRLSKLGLEVSGIIDEKCKFKDVTPKIQALKEREEDFKNAWESSLGHQLRDIPEFGDIFDNIPNLFEWCDNEFREVD